MTETAPKHRDLLIEIGTEELPPRALERLSAAFEQGVIDGLGKAGLIFTTSQRFATPRRLALLVHALAETTPSRDVEKRGPALQAAFDDNGCPTPAAEGFARSCGVSVEQLDTLETDKGSWLVYRSHQPGQPAVQLIPELVRQALDRLPIPKRMRWSDLEAQFVRPVHWIVLLFGDEVIETEILSVPAGRASRGHRFHHPGPIEIPAPAEYEVLLETEGKVMADLERRAETVRAQVEAEALRLNYTAVIDPDLLAEVTAMVEWPMAVTGNFEARFLEVPQEALISTMATNQKYFHLVNDQQTLQPHFITISNIESRDPDVIRAGNERVIRPRFSDAEFFWNQDRKTRLEARIPQLKTVVFQHKLGSLYDKCQRLAKTAAVIAEQLGGSKPLAIRAAELCKCDLLTEMVGEFPNLQGVMGRYYALHDGEDPAVAQAIDDHYRPRFAGDALPESAISQALALADRLDILVGIFAIGQIPSGDKDPYALRRAALGVLRILIEKQRDLDLQALLTLAARQSPATLKTNKAVPQVLEFVLERLRAYYQERDIRPDVLEAVLALQLTRPLDIDARIHAVDAFRALPEADSLAAANKRIGNILKKVKGTLPETIDPERLQEPAELALYEALNRLHDSVSMLTAQGDYKTALQQLAGLRQPVDAFFDAVMVMTDDPALRNNRIALLNQLHGLFLKVADISRLQQ